MYKRRWHLAKLQTECTSHFMSSAAASDARSGGGAGTWPTAVSVSPAQAAGLLGSSFRHRHNIVSAPRAGRLGARRAPGAGLCSCGRRRLPAMSNTAGCLRAIATGGTWTVPVYRVLRSAAAPVSRRFRVMGCTCVQDVGAAHVLAALPPAEEEHAVAHGGRRRAEHCGRRLAPAGAGRRRRAPAAARCRAGRTQGLRHRRGMAQTRGHAKWRRCALQRRARSCAQPL